MESEDAAENLVLQEVTQLLKFDASRYPVEAAKKKKKKRKIQEVTIEKFTDDELASARKLIAKETVRARLCCIWLDRVNADCYWRHAFRLSSTSPSPVFLPVGTN